MEGIITKLRKQINILPNFSNFVNDNEMKEYYGSLVTGPIDIPADYKSSVVKKENNQGYSLPTFGFSEITATIDTSLNQMVINHQRLLRTYNHIYLPFNPKDYEEFHLEFKLTGDNYNKYYPKNTTTETPLAEHFEPHITCGIIQKPESGDVTNILTKPTIAYERISQNTINQEMGTMFSKIMVKDLPANKDYYLVITNAESGDYVVNEAFNPDDPLTPKLKPAFTYSCPDLIKAEARVYNRPLKAPTNFKITLNKGGQGVTTDLIKQMENNSCNLIEGKSAFVTWQHNFTDDDTEIKTVTLPKSLSRGDVNLDGKIDEDDINAFANYNSNITSIVDNDILFAMNFVEVDYEDIEGVNRPDPSEEWLYNHVNGIKAIKAELPKGSLYQVDETANLYYYDIIDADIHENTKIMMYSSKLLDLGTFVEVRCLEGKARIYLTCCPYKSTVKIDYILRDEDYFTFRLRPQGKPAPTYTHIYDLRLKYDNDEVEHFWILPEGYEYLDVFFIKDLYNEYKKYYQIEPTDEMGPAAAELLTKNNFLALLPKITTAGYPIDSPYQTTITMKSEEEQYIDNLFMFRQNIVRAELRAIDEYGAVSEPAIATSNMKIYYPNNTPPSKPVDVSFKQVRKEVTAYAMGSVDFDTNSEYKQQGCKDIIRYRYYTIDGNNYIPINPNTEITLEASKSGALGDINKDGLINWKDLLRLSAIVNGLYVPIPEELELGDIDGNGNVILTEDDVIRLKDYIDKKVENLSGSRNYTYKDNNWSHNLGEYSYKIPVDVNKQISADASINLYSKDLYDLHSFKRAEREINADGYLTSFTLVLSTVLPNQTMKLSYSFEDDGDAETKLYEYEYIPNHVKFEVERGSTEVQYITIAARATDRMAWSEYGEYNNAIFPDIYLGIRNNLGGGSGLTGSVYIIANDPPTDKKDKKKIWYCSNVNSELYGTLNVWDENQNKWIPATGVFVG